MKGVNSTDICGLQFTHVYTPPLATMLGMMNDSTPTSHSQKKEGLVWHLCYSALTKC